ncbi:ankyrin repeat and BTB/POZ domain-containing protein 1 [Biomphalaria pfeifferi]|uniref:Ankyrin repeat and BTB/POZ domain-containing protein 1 n=1 Tax=Biomphalaria pfeifferi TaxID=112525 RepID=A0AAD8BFD3_BIOPF|nr:ankyrin repeat and BTB/POZ domain-containing protein 1 [Biomphalaria pfeifferi]
MDIQDLFHSCKLGDLQRLQYLVEIKEVEIDVRDKWDSTPLYYACLCGHRDIVEYLLEKGAKCEANTFDGERCLYGALTDEIRNLLKSYNVISSRTIRRDLYEEFLRRLLDSSLYSDAVFSVHGEEFHTHRCLLSARCLFFAQMFKTKWHDKAVVELNHSQMSPGVFKSILQYLYTGHMEVAMDLVSDCLKLAKQCQLTGLISELEDRMKKAQSWESSKLGVKVTTLVLEPVKGSDDVQRDLAQLAHWALPEELTSWIVGELPFEPETMPLTYPDVCFIVDDHRFMCHKAFFCGRSDYFKALLENHFGENENSGNIPVVYLHEVSIDVFLRILTYIYSDSADLNPEIVSDVLVAADMYLLPGLKGLCGTSLMEYVDSSNVVNMIRTSRLFNLSRLESHCAEFIANNLPEVIHQEEFRQLVVEDASNVKEREETDTIDVVDEIRYYISSFVLTYSEMEEANEKLKLIDNLLEELDIEG